MEGKIEFVDAKVDFKKELASYKAKRGVFDVVDVQPARYLMVDGHGDPNTAPEYMQAIEALYAVAYHLKFHSKLELGRDYIVPPLEGLWWAEDMDAFTGSQDKSQWDWTLMIMVPEWISDETIARIIETVAKAEKKPAPARLADLRVQELAEGTCVQTLHVGPYSEEGPLLSQMHHEFIPARGLRMTGKHHEIYFGDPRKSAPENLRTILRQPVIPAP